MLCKEDDKYKEDEAELACVVAGLVGRFKNTPELHDDQQSGHEDGQ